MVLVSILAMLCIFLIYETVVTFGMSVDGDSKGWGLVFIGFFQIFVSLGLLCFSSIIIAGGGAY